MAASSANSGYDVSIMIVTRNRPDYLEKCLSEIGRQRGASVETVVVDDHSDVALEPIIDRFRQTLEIKTLRLDQQNGCAAARNVGIETCSAEIVIQLDDDSWLVDEQACLKAATYLREHPEVGALALRVHYPNNATEDRAGRISPRWRRPDLSEEYTFQGCGVAFRRSIALRIGGYPGAFVYGSQEDWFAARLLSLGYQIRLFGGASVVHGDEVLQTDGKTLDWRRRNHIYSTAHLAITAWALLPIPLNAVGALLRLAAGVKRDPGLFIPMLARFRTVRRQVARQPMSWRHAIHYVRLLVQVRRSIEQGS